MEDKIKHLEDGVQILSSVTHQPQSHSSNTDSCQEEIHLSSIEGMYN